MPSLYPSALMYATIHSKRERMGHHTICQLCNNGTNASGENFVRFLYFSCASDHIDTALYKEQYRQTQDGTHHENYDENGMKTEGKRG